MSADPTRPQVGLGPLVLAELDADLRAAVEVVSLDAEADHDLSAVRFLAPGPLARWLVPKLSTMSALEVMQVASAGTDWIEPHLPPGVTLCSARGARDAPVAEWVLGALLGASSRLLERAGANSWADMDLHDLADWTVVIIGMGSIGRRVQAYLEPIGSTVIGVASRAREDLHGIDELDGLLPSADAIVLLAPLTEATHHLISGPQLATMGDGTLIINAARGAVLDTDALLPELQSGRLRAVLDVTDPEPLPDDHPLWSAPGLLSVTPHLAGRSTAGNRAAARLAVDQLRRWLAGEPLVNVVISG